MQSTNKYSLPETMFNALSNQSYKPIQDRLSVSDLINPPLIRKLKLEHWEDLEEDVSERLWALLGTAIHSVLQKHATGLTEEKLKQNIGGIDIVGKVDVYTEAADIEDYKVTSVYSFLLGDKIEWERQLNCYAWLFRKDGFPVNHLFINAILRDWQKSKVYSHKGDGRYRDNKQIKKQIESGDYYSEDGYPLIPFIRKEIPLWDFDIQEQYIKERVELFKVKPIECSPEEKWQRNENVALMQEGKKRAIKLFTPEEAKKITLSKGQYLEDRPAEAIRCLDYCPVRMVCSFNKEVNYE